MTAGGFGFRFGFDLMPLGGQLANLVAFAGAEANNGNRRRTSNDPTK
jgi:hypothetical protein